MNNIDDDNDDIETLVCVIGDIDENFLPRLFCVDCNRMTKSIEPVIMQRINYHFKFYVICAECGNTKTRRITYPDHIKELPSCLNNFDNYRLHVNEYKHNSKNIIFSDIINKLLTPPRRSQQHHPQLNPN